MNFEFFSRWIYGTKAPNTKFEHARQLATSKYAHLDPVLVEGYFSNPGFAARLSMLDLLVKSMDAIRPRGVLEVGSGLTTKCISSRLPDQGFLISIDQSGEWQKVTRNMLNANEAGKVVFVNATSDGQNIAFPLLGAIGLDQRHYDLLIIDGPTGDERFAPDALVFYRTAGRNTQRILIDDTDRTGNKAAAEQLAKDLQMTVQHIADDISPAHRYSLLVREP